MATIEVKVPDIGDFKDVPVVTVLVKAGEADQRDDNDKSAEEAGDGQHPPAQVRV